MSETPEGKLKRECRAWMREQGAYVFSPVQVGLGRTTLDDLVCYKGRFLAFEYKRPDTRPKPTPRQKVVIQEIFDAGGQAGAIYELKEVQGVFWGIECTLTPAAI